MPCKDPEKARERSAAWHVANLEKARAKAAAWHAANPEKVRAKDAAYRATHPEKVRARKAAYYATNCEKSRAYNAAWHAAHPEEARARKARRRARKANAPVNDFTARQWQELQAHYGYRCAYCGKKSKRLTQDHITPLIKGGSHTLSNIVPACRSCNAKKGRGAPLKPVQPLLV